MVSLERVSPERVLALRPKINEVARLAQRMDLIAENFVKLLPALGTNPMPPKVVAEVQEFEECVIALERLFNIVEAAPASLCGG